MMENWKKFLAENIQHVGLAVSKDQDKEMLVSIAGVDDENIRDWGDMLIISFNDPAVADAFISDPQVSNFDPRNVSQENLDSIEFATSPENMNIEPGERDIRHTRASGTKYKSKIQPWEEEEASVEWDFGPERGVELVTPARAEFLSKHRGIAKKINRVQTDQEIKRVRREKYGTLPEIPARVTAPDAAAQSHADTISTTPPSMSLKKPKKKKTEPYTRT